MQGLTMIAVSLAIVLQGYFETGGITEVVTINYNDGRLKFFKWVWDMCLIKFDSCTAIVSQFHLKSPLRFAVYC